MTSTIKLMLAPTIALMFSHTLLANTEHPVEKPVDVKKVTEHIYTKCISKGSSPVEQEVCKARKPAIEQCVEHEAAAKDLKTAKIKYELMLIAPSKK